MKDPIKVKARKSSRYPKSVKFKGGVEYRGVQRWVGTFPTAADWRRVARKVEADLIREVESGRVETARVPTVGEYAGVTVDSTTDQVIPRQGVTKIWPWTHQRNVRKESTFRRGAEGLRPFIRLYEDRPLDSFTRVEARAYFDSCSQGTRESVRRFFGDAIDDDLIPGRNPFAGLGYAKHKRKDRNDFEIITDEQFEAFRDAALRYRDDGYGLIARAIITLEGTTGCRPGEIFGTEHRHLFMAQGYIDLQQQIDDRGAITAVKNELRRPVPIAPALHDALLAMPRISDRWAFPAPRGGHLVLSNWASHWTAIRALAGRPDFEFYEMKHYALNKLVTPKASGGLGIDLPTAAVIAGHTDGGITLAKYYLNLDQQEAVARVRQAMQDAAGERSLRVVGD
jgi:hypothetical protein